MAEPSNKSQQEIPLNQMQAMSNQMQGPPMGWQPNIPNQYNYPPNQWQQPLYPPASYQQPPYPPGSFQQPPPTNWGQRFPGPTPQVGYQPAPGGMGPQTHQVWMQKPEVIPGCPPGLEYLTKVDQVLVHQQIELLEVFTNWETKNKYQIKNSMGQQVYYAAEESDVCARQCCGPQRGFTMHITDNVGNEVIQAIREFKCCAGPLCYCCANMDACAQELVIEAPPGHVIGRVKQQYACLEPRYAIENEEGTGVLQIRGPICICQGPCCTWDQEFKVFSADMTQEVGKISKQWSGFVREYFTDADNFGVSFPMDLDVKMKATMLGAVFLIDFMFFENNQQNQNN